MVRLKFEGRKLEDLDFWTKSDPFLTLNRPAKNGAAGLVQVRRTETVWNNLNPSWAVLYIPTTELCDDNFQLPLTIEVFDEDRNSRNDLIGRVELTLSDLQNLANTSSPVILTKGPKNRGQLLVTECQIEAPSSERERKESLTAYPPSRRESTYSMLGEFAHSRTDLELQADAHQLLGQGQEHCPAYQPIPQYDYNPTYQHVQPPHRQQAYPLTNQHRLVHTPPTPPWDLQPFQETVPLLSQKTQQIPDHHMLGPDLFIYFLSSTLRLLLFISS